ncbi:unnamed protein product, partial [Notodromas monacha]
MEMWKFGDYKSYTSLDLLAHVMGIPSPKSDIEGHQVAQVYYQDHDLERIRRRTTIDDGMNATEVLLEVKDFSVRFGDAWVVKAVNFKLYKGQTLGVVGESGSGKSVTAMAIMGLLPKQAHLTGEIWWHGSANPINILVQNQSAMRDLRRQGLGMIFQEPMTALNPSMRCGDQLLEAIDQSSNAHEWVMQWLENVRLPEPQRIFKAYPHELSGGQRQRVMIAMAMMKSPLLLIADEPTTALDVHVQKEILDLIQDLQKNHQTSVLFISHDLGVIRQMSKAVMVMYRGGVMEMDLVDKVFASPQHPYTKNLIACKPRLGKRPKHLPTIADFEKHPDFVPNFETTQERDNRLS